MQRSDNGHLPRMHITLRNTSGVAAPLTNLRVGRNSNVPRGNVTSIARYGYRYRGIFDVLSIFDASVGLRPEDAVALVQRNEVGIKYL